MTRSFDYGDLVIIRKQVQYAASAELAEKVLVLRIKGPYRVIKQISPHLYCLQKLPSLRGLGKPDRFCKESATRLEKIPFTLILHKRANGDNTSFASDSGCSRNPLENWLGIINRDAHKHAPHKETWPFERLQNIWN